LLYLWDLTRNGWANDFYSAAVQAGTKSWKAFFFGSFDSSNFITVDKTPASLWVMELSGRIFGFSQWSMLAPQALEGVASVALLYAAVRRWFGPAAGLIAGLVLALTPVAVLMFRFNNPDALLVLLMTAAAYALVRAIENGRTRWLVFCGVLLGFAFLAKMLQAFLVVPGFAIAYLWAGAPRSWLRRLWQTVLMGAGIIVGAGWWVLIAELTPAADRPYFGGSTDNNILQLAIGYNGLGRLDGNETGSIGGGGPGGSGFGGATGLLRLFHSEFGGQISWLLPAALICLGAMLWVSRRAVRTDRIRAAALLWGGWVIVTGLVFSYMSGIIHPYYMIALAPGIGALVGIGAMALWEQRLGWAGRAVAAATVLVTAVWSYVLLDRTPDWLPWLRWVVLLAGVLGAAAVLAGPWLASLTSFRRLVLVPVGLAMVAGLAGPAAYALDTVNTAHTGAIPSAGPAAAGFGGGPGGFGGTRSGGFAGARPGGTGTSGTGTSGTGTSGTGTGGTRPGGTAGNGFPGGATGQFGGPGGSSGTQAGSSAGSSGLARPGGAGAAGGPGGTGGPGGGLGGNTQVSSALVKLLKQNASAYKWVAATEGSTGAAPLELATGDAVMAIGGFNGTDPWPTLAVFKELVAKHEVHYYVGQGSESFGGGRGSSAIASWVAAHFKKETVGGQTVYDLTQPLSALRSARVGRPPRGRSVARQEVVVLLGPQDAHGRGVHLGAEGSIIDSPVQDGLIHGDGGRQALRGDQVAPGGEEVDGAGGRRQAGHRGRRAQVVGDDHAIEVQLLAQQPHDAGGERRQVMGVDARVGGQSDHDERHAGLDGRLERLKVRALGAGRRVDHPGAEIGVAHHAAQAGEVLGGGRDSGLSQAADERRAVRPGDLRGVAELPLQRADRRVLARGRARYDVHHRGQVEVDARRPQLAAPRRGPPLQFGGGQLALGQGGRDGREAGAGQFLDLAAFLVGRDEEPDLGRGGGRRQGLNGLGCPPVRGHAGRARALPEERPEMIGTDRLGDFGLGGSGDAHQEQLADALGLAHLAEDLNRAGRPRWPAGGRPGGQRLARSGTCDAGRGLRGLAARREAAP
jgi:4-amino-4-deoxy-L-arabinose transferase-like glycosyltransferase